MVKIPKGRMYVEARSRDDAIGKFSKQYKGRPVVFENIRLEGKTVTGRKIYTAKVRARKR